MNKVVINFFDKDSREQFLRGPRIHLGSLRKTPSCPAGTIVVLCDLTLQEAWGICTLKNWEGTASPCREHHLLDEDIYTGKLSKYNKYDICIDTLRILREPIPFEDIRVLVGGTDDKKTGNMWRGFHSSFTPPFGGDPLSVKRYVLWARSLL